MLLLGKLGKGTWKFFVLYLKITGESISISKYHLANTILLILSVTDKL